MATFTWSIPQLERDLFGDMAGAVVLAHWRCDAEQTEGTGDSKVTYRASTYGGSIFDPDPAAAGYIQYQDITEADAIQWVHGQQAASVTEENLQSEIDGQVNPTLAYGVPWS